MPINIKPQNRGKFSAKAKAAGMSVQAYAAKVLADPTADVVTKRQANFAKNAKSFNHNKKAVKKAGAMMRRTAGGKP